MDYDNDKYKSTKCYNNNYYSKAGKELNRATLYIDCETQEVADRIKGRLWYMNDFYTVSQPGRSNGASFEMTSRLANAIDDMMSNPDSELYKKYFPELTKKQRIEANRFGICVADMCQSNTYKDRENKYIFKDEVVKYMNGIDWD